MSKLKGFLKNGFDSEEGAPVEEHVVSVPVEVEELKEEQPNADVAEIAALRDEVAELKAMIQNMVDEPPMPDLSAFVTTREQLKSINNAIDRQNVEINNKALVSAMEQISLMREDFIKLCNGMRGKIGSMKAEDVLSSFEAYQVDLENILADAGVFVGHFDNETLDTIQQRVVDVIPTDDQDKNGKIAERLSEGYKFGDRVIVKEKVTIFRYTETAETPLETTSTENKE